MTSLALQDAVALEFWKFIDMSLPNNPTLSEPETEQREHRGPRVHFRDGSRFQPQPHAQPVKALSTPHDDHDALPHVSHPQPVARPSNESASPQRFTNPFGGSEWGPDNPISNPALDGVTLYHTQLPVCGSGTLNAHRDVLEPSRDSFQTSSQAEMPLTRDRYLWSSYQHPYEIEPPSSVYNNATFGSRRPTMGSIGTQRDGVCEDSARLLPPRYSIQDSFDVPLAPMPRRFRGGFANMLELWRVYWQQAPDQSEFVVPYDALLGDRNPRPGLMHSRSSFGYDPDDPKITGTKKLSQDDPEDAESQCRQEMNLQYMSYRQRRKEAQKIKIQFNVTCKFCFSSSDSSVLSPWALIFTPLPTPFCSSLV
ncbi:hypothetical protein BJV78DRAFT_476153 [Lactifluus subvellereus]|nr:hypothetical protein BJV78DRAFT_476153 [Lactifluus subvellereus]